MSNSIGTKEPIEFFSHMVSLFEVLFDKIDKLEAGVHNIKTNSALAIMWEPKVAANMISKQIEILRKDKETYFAEISSLKEAYSNDIVTQNYSDFCEFWITTLGWHPFLDYK